MIVSPADLAALPDPVIRFFSFALAPNQPAIARARFDQTGTMRTGARSRWMPFHAVQQFSTSPPVFVWEATMRVAPFLAIRVRDAYRDGAGTSEARLAGLIPLGSQRGTPEVAAASLVRYLAEAVWFPTALLPSDAVSWRAIDDRNARVTLTDRATTVALDVEFSANGEIVRSSTHRYRDVNGTPVLTPWSGTYGSYTSTNGMMIPMTAEVSWMISDVPITVWRGAITAATYEFV